MRIILVILFLPFSIKSYCQHTLEVIVTDHAAIKAEQIFITGNFNNWNPKDSVYQLIKTDSNNWKIILNNLPSGNFMYKFTKGSWSNEETNAGGENIENHLIQLKGNTTVNLHIFEWKNEKIKKEKVHTASKNVHIITNSFYIPFLKRYRQVWIYLPANYAKSKNHYPVLYMHDGQNLFDDFTAAFAEWGIDEALDSLQKQTGKYAIVVGIDHGDKHRLTEYNPYDSKYGNAEGQEYVKFIAFTLKPFIDKHYRTKIPSKYTAMAGSSMGALISTFGILKYQQIFGNAGIFSPAYWMAPSLKNFVDTVSIKNKNIRCWFYVGKKESNDMVPDMLNLKKIIEAKFKMQMITIVDEEAGHNEEAWRKYFPAFYKWWMASV